MIETDYIMRMIGLLATSLARLFFLKRAKEFPQALVEIDSTEKSLLGVDRNLVRSLSPSQIMNLFGSDLSLALPKRYVLGVLLKEEADILFRRGEGEESAASALKSLDLLTDTLLKSGNTLDAAHEKHLLDVVGLLRGHDLPAESQEKLFACYEALGRFDKAENALFELLALDARFYETGRLFYQRLLARSDDNLIRGKLPRPEVVEGAREFKRRFDSMKS
jgi:tetratricopeptide (TPR) repeat protein